ncbi:MAG: tRNA (adenosine(37)-N6)-dimethylallyltransferase MiaA [Bacteroidota bacterium]
MSTKKYLVVISGPTAVGKTDLCIALAQQFGTEIISCDSRQFYREMNIGTAKPTPGELARVKHHFIDDLSIHDAYSVGDFERDGLQLLEELYTKFDLVFLTGGSGLYIRALCEGLDEFPEVPEAVTEHYKQLFNAEGIGALQDELHQLDPDYAAKVDLQNPHRLIRALSVCKASGQPFSSFHGSDKPERPFTPVYICLHREREELYDRINRRVDWMMERGLLEEARELFPFQSLNALQTVGYQELFDYFEETITLETAVELIKRNTRRYAKRQGTWFRKNDYWQFFAPHESAAIQQYIVEQTGLSPV